MDLQYLEHELIGAGLGDVIRNDAKFTAFLDKQLEFVKTETFDIVYPALKGRSLIPVNNSVNTGATTITYRQWDGFGAAQIISNYADDLPNVDVKAEEFISKIQSIGDSYEWSIQDLRASAMTGAQLDTRRAATARMVIENKIEDVAALGDADGGLLGFFNQPNVPLIAPITGDWAGAATPLQIIADLNKLVNSIITTSKQTFIPDTLVIDIAGHTILNSKPMSLTGDADKTVLKFFLDNNPYINNIEPWFKADLADAAGTGERMCAYMRSPTVLTQEIPQEYESFPPQATNLAFKVPNHARIGGVIVYYPIAMAYMEGYV